MLVIWLCWGLPLSKVLGFAVGSVVMRLGFVRRAVSSVSGATAIRFSLSRLGVGRVGIMMGGRFDEAEKLAVEQGAQNLPA